MFHPTFFLLAVLLRTALAQTNRTIDDVNGDSVSGAKVQYLPTSFAAAGGAVWKSSSSCTGCAITPDTSKAFDNTWTSATYFGAMGKMSAGFSFEGTAIYIYLIQSNYPTSTGLVSSTFCDFNIDGQVVGQYQHTTDGSFNFQYNVLAFSSTSLSDGQHTVLIETTGNDSVYVIFDYAVYTTNARSSPPVTTSNNPPPAPVTPSTSSSNSPSTSPSSPSSSPTTSQTTSQTAASASTPATSSNSNSNSNSISTSLSSSHPVSTTSPSSNAPAGSTSASSSHSNNLTTTNKASPTGAIAGGVVGAIIVVIALIFLTLVLCRRRRRRGQYGPPAEEGQPGIIIDATAGAPGPPMADLQHQITERRNVMDELEQRSQSPTPTEDGADVRRQMEEMREQIRRLEAQQLQSRGGSATSGSSVNNRSSLAPTYVESPHGSPVRPLPTRKHDASATSGSSVDNRSSLAPTYVESPDSSPIRPLPTRKHDASVAVRSTPQHSPQPSYPSHTELLVHSDSGMRMNMHTGLLELPPSYVAE